MQCVYLGHDNVILFTYVSPSTKEQSDSNDCSCGPLVQLLQIEEISICHMNDPYTRT